MRGLLFNNYVVSVVVIDNNVLKRHRNFND